MYESLLNLPHVHLWLPAVAAAALGVPVYLYALRANRRLAPASPSPDGPAEAVDPFTVGSTTEQRKAFRRKGNPIEIFFTPKEEPSSNARGYVLDRSISGLKLMIPKAVATGAILSVRPTNVSPMVPWVEVEVRNCVPSTTQPGEFDVGCRFVKAPPYPVLLLFG
jgi:hypothetical protein